MSQPLSAAKRNKRFGAVSLRISIVKIGCAALLSLGVVLSASAQPAAAPAIAPAPGRQAIEVRKALFVLIANNFKPVGETLQGKIPYDAAELRKRSARVAFLAELVGEAFPDVSNNGLPDTKAKSEIWSDRAAFDKRVGEFREHAATLAQVAAKEQSSSDAVKAAAAAVGQDCKGCHEAFKVK